VGNSLGSVGVRSLTVSYTPRSMNWVLFLAHTFASPHLSCEPKVRVTTLVLLTPIPKVSWQIVHRLIRMLFISFTIMEIFCENDSPRMNLFLPLIF
jgi:hypothetical protein